MNLILTKDPAIWAYLSRWYVPVDQSRIEIGTELFRRLSETPDDTFVSIVTEDGKVVAFVVAYVLNENDVFLWQTRTLPGFNYGKELFDMLVNWTKEKSRSRIVASTERSIRPLERKYGFKPFGGLIAKEI